MGRHRLGGAAPALLFVALGSIFGAPHGRFLPLLSLAALGAGGAIGVAVARATQRDSLSAAVNAPALPAA